MFSNLWDNFYTKFVYKISRSILLVAFYRVVHFTRFMSRFILLEPVLKHCKASKYYDQDCRSIVLSFIQFVKLKTIKIYWKQAADHLLLPHIKLKKQTESYNFFPCPILFIIFEEKYFSHYILLIDETLFSNCLYFEKYWYNCLITSLWHHKFWN